MASPRDDAPAPMAEPGKHPQGADLGGIQQSADGGLADAAQRSMEQGDGAEAAPAIGANAKPAAPATPVGTKNEPPASGSARQSADWDDDEGEQWRHAPVAPKDAGPLESLGKSISDAVTGSAPDRSKGPKT